MMRINQPIVNNKIKIAPSIISADLTKLDEEVKRIEESGADFIHIDSYPLSIFAFEYNRLGRFAIGHFLLDFLRRRTSLPLDIHIAMERELDYIEKCIDLGADIISFHPEPYKDPMKVVELVKERGVKLGLGITVSTDLESVFGLCRYADLITVVSANVNFAGKIRLEDASDKIRKARELCGDKVDIAIDGGVNPETIPLFVRSGANVLIVGRYFFGHKDYRRAVIELKRKALELLKPP